MLTFPIRPISIAALLLAVPIALAAGNEPAKATAGSATNPTLISVEKICDDAPHSAFTSLVRFNDQWVCAFRQASAHKGVRDARIRVLVSNDSKNWQTATTLNDPRGDIRDAKMAVMSDGSLILLTAVALFDTHQQNHQSIAFITKDLKTWEGPIDVGDPDVWLWGINWHKDVGYSVGYSTKGPHAVQLYQTVDGRKFEKLGEKLDTQGLFATESAIEFDRDDTAHILVRCDPNPAYLATARPPYTNWTIVPTDTRVGGPALIQAPDGRLLGAGRLYDPKQRTSLFWIDPQTAKITECLALPSGGDTSYPGLLWHDGVLNMSYYSSHEGNAKIYFAHVNVPSTAGEADGSGK